MTSVPASELPQVAQMPSATLHPTSLARLAMLHDEARETALLANLLSRAPRTAFALACLAFVTAALSFLWGSAPALIAVWLSLVGAGVASIARSYVHTIKAPFERVPLKAFSRELSAILFYTGFAWGTGAFLVLPATAPLPGMLLFSAGACLVVAAVLRARDQSLFFLAPIAGLSALALLMRGDTAGLEILVVCGVLAAMVSAGSRLFVAPDPRKAARIPAL